MSGPLKSRLELRELVCKTRLGWTLEERAHDQEVAVDLVLLFDSTPAAIHSDELRDTLCYGGLSEQIQALCTSREFRLIEHLAHQIFEMIKQKCPASSQLELSVTKLKAPVPGLRGGATFTLSNRNDR